MDSEKEFSLLRDQVRKKLPQEVNEANDRLINQLVLEKYVLKGPQQGDELHKFQKNFDFVLPDATGRSVRFTTLLEAGPVVLSFYRGNWCPYCNLQLKLLKAESAAIQKLGAQLVAISPELPDHSLSSLEKEGLGITVLSDERSEVANTLGISYAVPEYLLKTFASYGFDFSKHYNRKKVELPIPATFVIDQSFIVKYSFASEDFTKRAKIARILDALEEIKAAN